jgi:hypothetical protein
VRYGFRGSYSYSRLNSQRVLVLQEFVGEMMAHASKALRRRALARMSSAPPAAAPCEGRPSGIELRAYEPAPLDLEVPAISAPSEPAPAPEFEVHDDTFFSSPQLDTRALDLEDADQEVPADRHSQLDVVARRAKASRGVRNLIIACAALMGAAVLAHQVRAKREAAAEQSLLQASNASANALIAQSAAVLAIAPPPATVAQAPVVTTEAPASVPSAIPADVVVVPAATASAPSVVLDAKAEKRAAERDLDSGKLATALVHAQNAVDADAEDAGAWLLLGAVKQAKGDSAGARIAFQSCIKEGKRGPKYECASMLR